MHVPRVALRLQQGIRSQLLDQAPRRWFARIALALTLSTFLLLVTYRQPFVRQYPVDAWLRHAEGVYESEQIGELEYAYTNGDASFTFPEIGRGYLLATLQLGGPAGSVPLPAHLDTATKSVDLGVVDQVRLYHLLVPGSSRGHLRMQLTSPAQRIGADPRPLGLLAGPILVKALGPALPAPSQLATMFVTLCLFALATAQFSSELPWKASWFMLLGALLSAPLILTRGMVALQPWWLGFGAAAVISIGLWRAEAWPRITGRGGVVLVCSAWCVALWLVALAGLRLSTVIERQWHDFSFKAGPPGSDLGRLSWRAVVDAWLNWDGVHYRRIAEAGYTFQGVPWPTIAFFPLYPLLIRAVLALTGTSSAIAALAVSHLALLLAALLLYDLLVRDFGRLVAYRAIIFVLVFPPAFFFVAGYTESLALLLAVAAVWAMRRQRWWLAGAAGGLLAMTRVPGVLIAPVLGLVYGQHHHWRWRSLRLELLAVLLPPLGLGLFMLYQWQRFGTPWAFLIAQQSWDNGLAPPWIIPKRIITALGSAPEWQLATLQLGVWLGVLGLAFLALRRLPLEYGVTGLLLIVPAYCANIRDSLPRHVLISFPIFVVLALVVQRLWLRWLIVTLLLPLLVLLTMLFVNGFWIG